MSHFKKALLLVVFGLVLLILHSVLAVLTPLIVAAVLAYLTDPVVERLTRYNMPRVMAVLLVFLILLLAFVGMCLWLVPLFAHQLNLLAEALPKLLSLVEHVWLPWLNQHFGAQLSLDFSHLPKNFSHSLKQMSFQIIYRQQRHRLRCKV